MQAGDAITDAFGKGSFAGTDVSGKNNQRWPSRNLFQKNACCAVMPFPPFVYSGGVNTYSQDFREFFFRIVNANQSRITTTGIRIWIVQTSIKKFVKWWSFHFFSAYGVT